MRIDSKDTSHLIQELSVPAIAMIGEHDFVGAPPVAETRIVKGGHVSPLEVPQDVNELVASLMVIADRSRPLLAVAS